MTSTAPTSTSTTPRGRTLLTPRRAARLSEAVPMTMTTMMRTLADRSTQWDLSLAMRALTKSSRTSPRASCPSRRATKTQRMRMIRAALLPLTTMRTSLAMMAMVTRKMKTSTKMTKSMRMTSTAMTSTMMISASAVRRTRRILTSRRMRWARTRRTSMRLTCTAAAAPPPTGRSATMRRS